MSPEVLSVLEALEADEHLPQSGHFETLEDALEAALLAIRELQKKSDVKGTIESSQRPAIA